MSEHIVPSAQARVTPSAHARVTEAEQRSDRAQDPCALRVAAARGHLRRWPTSTIYLTSPAVGRLAAGPAALATRPTLLSPGTPTWLYFTTARAVTFFSHDEAL